MVVRRLIGNYLYDLVIVSIKIVIERYYENGLVLFNGLTIKFGLIKDRRHGSAIKL